MVGKLRAYRVKLALLFVFILFQFQRSWKSCEPIETLLNPLWPPSPTSLHRNIRNLWRLRSKRHPCQ